MMKLNMRGKNFISLMDFSSEELLKILDIATLLKNKLLIGEPHELLRGKTLGLLFMNPSTRTRISFETGMTQLGGHAQFYDPQRLQMTAQDETIKDTANVIGRYINGIAIRHDRGSYYGETREILRTFAKAAGIPLINALDDKEHPCQVMADVMTIREKFPKDWRDRKVVMAWAYSNRRRSAGVPQAMVAAASLLGMRLILAHPANYDLDKEYINFANKTNAITGGQLETTNDIYEACKGADVIYAKSWMPSVDVMTPEEDLKYREPFKTDWCINSKHLKLAQSHAVYMHCLPAHRGLEVTDEVIDGPQSIVVDEAENRLHAQKGILATII